MAQFPRNPYLHHRRWRSETREAWQAGRREVAALCGAPTPLERDPDTTWSEPPDDELIAPGEVRDQDYEDPETGLWWVEMDCVDCLRVSNAIQRQIRIRKARDAINAALASAAPESWTLQDCEDLLQVLGRIADELDGRPAK